MITKSVSNEGVTKGSLAVNALSSSSRPERTGVSPSFHDVVHKIRLEPIFEPIIQGWAKTENATNHQISRLSPELRKLFELQRSISSLHLQTECITHLADAVGSTMKRVHQLGGQ